MEDLILLFDGECRLCSRLVRFTARRDDGAFRFVPLQSEEAEELLEGSEIDPGEMDTFVILEKGDVYERSDAAVKLLKKIGGLWKVVALLLRLFPRPIRDFGYRLVSRSRYRVFGKKDECMVPDQGIADRFAEN